MSKKSKFIEDVEKFENELSTEGKEFFELFKTEKPKEPITEKGLVILNYMKTVNDVYTAAEIGAGVGITGRSASGTLQKLVADGFAEKVAAKPSRYILTEKGKNYNKGEE